QDIATKDTNQDLLNGSAPSSNEVLEKLEKMRSMGIQVEDKRELMAITKVFHSFSSFYLTRMKNETNQYVKKLIENLKSKNYAQIENLFEEMERKNIFRGTFTYDLLMQSYALRSDWDIEV